MANTVEELFKKSNEVLEAEVRVPAIFQKLAERGYAPKTEEEAQELMNVAEATAISLANGEIEAIPSSALESDGSMSKHASAAASGDFLHFAPECEINIAEVDENVKEAAANVALASI